MPAIIHYFPSSNPFTTSFRHLPHQMIFPKTFASNIFTAFLQTEQEVTALLNLEFFIGIISFGNVPVKPLQKIGAYT
jgi:hypothetical protein